MSPRQLSAGNVSARPNALHCLGATLHPKTSSANQALQQGKLSDWNLRKVPLHVEVGPQKLVVPDRFAVIRDSPMIRGMVEVMGDVGKSYTIIQNEDLEDLLDTLKDEFGARFDAAGEIDGGRRAFVTLKLPGVAKIGGADVVDNYITVINSHDGNTSAVLMITPVRVSDSGTLNISFKKASHVFKIRHSVGAHKLIAQQAREAMEFTFSYLDAFQEEADRLISTTLTQARFEELITRNFGAPKGAPAPTVTRTQNKLDQMAELFSDSYSLAGVGETAWAGLNALTEWHDFYSPVRGVGAGGEAAVRSRKALLDSDFKNQAMKIMMAHAN